MKLKAILLTTVLILTSCAGGVNQSAKGTLAGGALGAGLGAIVGNAAGNTGAGIAIGAAGGALGGALIGNSMDEQDQANQQLGQRVQDNQRQLDENRRLIEELKRRGADVRSSKRGVVINLPDILFEFNKDRLTPVAHRTITEIGDVLRDVRGRRISVEGHTDSIGSVTYNKDLSLRRAQSVESDLTANGIPAAQLRTVGFGEGSPIATNNTDEGRARNRRVEVIVENN